MASGGADEQTIRVKTSSLQPSEIPHQQHRLFTSSFPYIHLHEYLSLSISLHRSPQGHLKRCLDLFYHIEDFPLLSF